MCSPCCCHCWCCFKKNTYGRMMSEEILYEPGTDEDDEAAITRYMVQVHGRVCNVRRLCMVGMPARLSDRVFRLGKMIANLQELSQMLNKIVLACDVMCFTDAAEWISLDAVLGFNPPHTVEEASLTDVLKDRKARRDQQIEDPEQRHWMYRGMRASSGLGGPRLGPPVASSVFFSKDPPRPRRLPEGVPDELATIADLLSQALQTSSTSKHNLAVFREFGVDARPSTALAERQAMVKLCEVLQDVADEAILRISTSSWTGPQALNTVSECLREFLTRAGSMVKCLEGTSAATRVRVVRHAMTCIWAPIARTPCD
jgi:hypothetical protein